MKYLKTIKICIIAILIIVLLFGITCIYLQNTTKSYDCVSFLDNATSVEIKILGGTASDTVFTIEKEKHEDIFRDVINIFTATSYKKTENSHNKSGRGSRYCFYDQYKQCIGEIYIHTENLLEINEQYYCPKDSLDFMLESDLVYKYTHDHFE